MSIEQALEKVLSWEFGTDPERYRVRDYIQADLDALVREVKASMPCYWAEWRGDDGPGCSGPSLCPSCTEREALKV